MKKKSNLAERMLGKTTFFVGNKKNAGKTTFLNYALEQVRSKDSPVILTIGIDGESRDLIFKNPKPRVLAKTNDYVITTDKMIERSDALFEVLHVFPIKTKLGRLVLVKTLRSGFVELVGAEDNGQLVNIIDFLREEMNLKSILVDGAVNRKTQVAGVQNGHFFYILKLEAKTLNSDLEKLRILSRTIKFPQFEENDLDNSKIVFEIKGALSNSKINQIPEDTELLLLEDFTKIFVDLVTLKGLRERFQIAYKKVYQLEAFVVILKDITKTKFEELIALENLQEPIIYNPYEY